MKIVHISIYPPKGERHSESGGVASYTKNLIDNIKHSETDEVFVLCNKLFGKTEDYRENNVQVIRCFDKNISFFWQLSHEIKKIHPDIIHIQQELSLYGNILTAYLLQWLVFFLKKYQTVITLHGVVDLNKVNRSFVRENNSHWPSSLVKLALLLIYGPLCHFSKKIIVHEDFFKDILVTQYRAVGNKIVVINHGIEDLRGIAKEQAGTNLGLDFKKDLCLYLGYFTGYKGLDLLIDGFSEYTKINDNAFLIIGAGKHPKLKNDPNYLKEYDRLRHKAETLLKPSQFVWAGFIEEGEIVDYFSVSDVSIFPYTIQMSSSGPMALSIAYGKPFLASDAFANFLKNDRMLFAADKDSLKAGLDRYFKHRTEFAGYLGSLRKERLWSAVGGQTHRLYVDLSNNVLPQC